MYRPRYCAECGRRIERERWRFWHSRQFCDVCARHFERRRRAGLGALLIASLVLGFLMGRLSGRAPSPNPVLRIERLAPVPQMPSTLPSVGPRSPTAGASENITRCGAPTKSGRPCQRRVRGGGRCWQHREVATQSPTDIGRPAPIGNP